MPPEVVLILASSTVFVKASSFVNLDFAMVKVAPVGRLPFQGLIHEGECSSSSGSSCDTAKKTA